MAALRGHKDGAGNRNCTCVVHHKGTGFTDQHDTPNSRLSGKITLVDRVGFAPTARCLQNSIASQAHAGPNHQSQSGRVTRCCPERDWFWRPVCTSWCSPLSDQGGSRIRDPLPRKLVQPVGIPPTPDRWPRPILILDDGCDERNGTRSHPDRFPFDVSRRL